MTGPTPPRGDGHHSTETHDLVAWALRVDLVQSASGNIGRSAVRCVLVALALRASSDGYAWPSAETIAHQSADFNRRDVRNAFELLEAQRVITRVGKAGRTVKWRLNHDLAGYPAIDVAGDLAGDLAGNLAGNLAGDLAGNLAGDLAGNLAGDLAGNPATNRRDFEQTPPPAPRSSPVEASQTQTEAEAEAAPSQDDPTGAPDYLRVLVDSLPEHLRRAANNDHSQLDATCEQFVAQGWSIDDLERVLRSKDWTGAGYGAVIRWSQRQAEQGPPDVDAPRALRSTARRCSNRAPIAEDGSCCVEHDLEHDARGDVA